MMRVIALIELFMLAIANLVRILCQAQPTLSYHRCLQTLRRRLDPPRNTGPFFSWHDFQKPAFSVYVLGCVLIFLGYFTRRFHDPFAAIIPWLT